MAADKKPKAKVSGSFITLALMGVVLIVGMLFYMINDLNKKVEKLSEEFAKIDMNSNSAKEEMKNILYYIENESSYGKVYEKLLNNIVTRGKNITDGIKPPTDFLCGDDKLNSVLQFHPSGFVMVWSDEEMSLKYVRDFTKADTGYFYITKDKKMKFLLFDNGKTILQEAKNIKTNKYNVIRSFTLGSTNISYENCPPDFKN